MTDSRNTSNQLNNELVNSGVDTDIPIVSLSELLEENAEIFNLNDNSNLPNKSAVTATTVANPQLNESDDDIQFVENISPKSTTEEITNTAGERTNKIGSSGESNNETTEGSSLLPQTNLHEDVNETNKNDSPNNTEVTNNVSQHLTTPTDITIKSPQTDVVILLDDDDDEQKMEVDPFDELKKTNIPNELPEKRPTEKLLNREKDDKIAEASDNLLEAVQMAKVDNDQLLNIEIEPPKEFKTTEHTETHPPPLTSPTTATSTNDEDVIMLDDEFPANTSKECENDKKDAEGATVAIEVNEPQEIDTPSLDMATSDVIPTEPEHSPSEQGTLSNFLHEPQNTPETPSTTSRDLNENNTDENMATPTECESADLVPCEIAANVIIASSSISPERTLKRKAASKPLKDCVNSDCPRKCYQYYEAPQFIINHYRVNKKTKIVYVCEYCYDTATDHYEMLCGALEDHQPLLQFKHQQPADLVEILDSSDEETDNDLRAGMEGNGKSDFNQPTLDMIKDNLDDIITETLSRINIDQQMKWNRSILLHQLDTQRDQAFALQEEMKNMQKLADQMHTRLYRSTNVFVEEMPSWDSITGKELQLACATYPPHGQYVYPKVDTIELYYSVRQKVLAAWAPCRVTELPLETNPAEEIPMYKVKFLRPIKNLLTKSVPGTNLAYGKAPLTRLQVGVRVIALFNMSAMVPRGVLKDNGIRFSFFPGIVAEPLQKYNGWRYLIFFDDGYARYVQHENVRVVCDSNKNVWENIDAGSSEFIRNYLKQFSSRRPMVQVRKHQRMMTEWNGKWINARVNDVDASLVQMSFDDGKRLEWIYRGSTRLGPLFREKQTQRNTPTSGTPKQRNEPVIEYIVIDDDNTVVAEKPKDIPPAPQTEVKRTFPAQAVRETPQQQQQQQKRCNVARKSTVSQPLRPTVQHLNNSTIYVDEDNKPKGKVVYYTAKKHLPPRKFELHECGTGCLYTVSYNLSSYSPLSKPLLSGWERQICKSKQKKVVVYRAPCGRRLRNMTELHQYIRMTKCTLNVENFDFDFLIHCLAEYVIDTYIVQKSDISEGTESMVVPCVNYYDNTYPPPCTYSAKRIPTSEVNLNLDTEFLCGCDCEDDCLDKMKCQCQQLTIAGAKFGNPNTPPEEVGYEFKRLPEPVPTGIYECNPRCKCSKTCLNRVAQHSLQMKLQVFKTGNRGWGLRCLNDVPKGSFICCYAGHLLTEQFANEAGENMGDEYFAELDYIEVVENLKEGYEPDVMNDDDNEEDDDLYDPASESQVRDDDSDDEFNPRLSAMELNGSVIKTRYSTRNANKKEVEKSKEPEKSDSTANGDNGGGNNGGGSDEDEERQPISFMPHSSSAMNYEKDNDNGKYKSIRKFFGKNESVYIMDAKKCGNIGRYFNHSCAPNLFVQNVFVDTHDLRFPWVSFFALSHIRAGTELTWNYNYEVGSVPGKVLHCQCGSESCRGRLL